MSLLLMDGFDMYPTGTLTTTITQGRWVVNSTPQLISGGGKFAGNHVQMTNSIHTLSTPDLGVQAGVVTIGFHFKPVDLSGSAAQNLIVVYSDVGQVDDELRLLTTPTGVLEVRRGAEGGTLLGSTGAGTIIENAWQFVEFQFKIHNTTGEFTVKVNNNQVLTATGQDTSDTGTESARIIALSGEQFSDYRFDDVYILNDTGAKFNSFLGDIQIATQTPNGTTLGNWATLVGAATHHEAVDDAPGDDGDTTYVASNTSSQQDLFDMTDNAIVTTPTAVNAVVRVREESSTADTMIIQQKVAGNTQASPAKDVGTAYEFVNFIREDNPAGGAWADADLDSLEIGIQVS